MKNYTADPFMRAIFGSGCCESGDKSTQDNNDNAMLESAGQKGTDTQPKPKDDIATAMMEAVESRAQGDMRSLAASMHAVWVEDGD
ncbi:hypothetical protein NX042_25585, partial [Escherichia coli]|nr:hypothetical protein [Escherichia coli]